VEITGLISFPARGCTCGVPSRRLRLRTGFFRVVDDAAILARVTITTASLLSSLETIAFETTKMLAALDDANAGEVSSPDRREVKRRVVDRREKVHELIEELSAVRLEEPRN
jgi:hypothetical protein